MDVRSAVRAFVEQGRELYQRLRSSEGDAVSPTDLHILEVQMYLLDKEVARRKAATHAWDEKDAPRPDLPPFTFDDEKTQEK